MPERANALDGKKRYPNYTLPPVYGTTRGPRKSRPRNCNAV